MLWHEGFDRVRCVVTGAGGGIGRAVAAAFREVGASVLAVDVAGSSASGDFLECDITDAGDRGRVFAETEKDGVDVLVNAAGIMHKALLEEVDWEQWDRVYDVNCRGTLQLTQALLPLIASSGRGRIINIVSMTATVGLPTYGPYSTAKAALLNATRVLAAEFADKGITANSISPGWVDTPMTEGLYTRLEHLHQLRPGAGRGYVESLIPQHRLVQPEEIAGAALYLASVPGGAITGHDLVVDGGLTSLFQPEVHVR